MAGGTCSRFLKTLGRKKYYQPDQLEQTSLQRCLTQWDVMALGVGSTLGVGMYFIFGYVSLMMAGPSVTLSFLIAAVAALFAGLCHGEMASRAPRAGSPYTYTSMALGKLAGFLVGWLAVLQGLCSAASIARGLSLYMDTAFKWSMAEWFAIVVPGSISLMSDFFDFFAFLIALVIGGLLVVGVRESTLVNNLFSAGTVVLVVFIVILGAFKADPANLRLPPTNIPEGHGEGEFFPYGFRGMLRGAAVCFYAFMGFDSICAAGEEVKEPRRVIPITILIVLGVIFVSYIGISVVVSMMVPYYKLNEVIALSDAFLYVNWTWAKYIISLGSIFGLYASLFGALYPATRVLYAMCGDGLLPRALARLTRERRSPAIICLICTVVTALLAGLLQYKPLLQMVPIGALITYTAVACSVVVLRYNCNYTPGRPRYLRQLFGLERSPSFASCRIVNVALFLFVAIALTNALVAVNTKSWNSLVWIILCAVFNGLEIILVIAMMIQPQVKEDIYFKTPLVPLVPCLSIYINIHLVIFNVLDLNNWVMLAFWIAIGILIYILTVSCCSREHKDSVEANVIFSQSTTNGKPPLKIIVESPTPPDTLTRVSNNGGHDQTEDIIQKDPQTIVRHELPVITEEIVLHQAYIENNEEKEAKIIDLLDQVLQAEEDSYGEVISFKEKNEYAETEDNAVPRKSLSELSDAGSDASLGNQGLSKYDVVAQVHREDLPKVSEEEEKFEREHRDDDDDEIDDHEEVTAFNDSDTNSRTDESGYSDTIDRNTLSESLEESKENIPIIPVPPPLDENFFRSPNFRKSYTIGPSKPRNNETALKDNDDDERENKPRTSVKSILSNGSQNEDNITFGSDRQIHFMSKLNNIFQNKINSDDTEPRQRSHSTGNVAENTDYAVNRERNPLFLALKGEIMAREAAQNLRPVSAKEMQTAVREDESAESAQPEEEEEEAILTKEELKSKLENIFAAGGPQLLKARLMKSNPPTPEDSYHTDVSSTESLPKLPKIEKNDTLKRQKAKFNEVLNSFRISFNADDV